MPHYIDLALRLLKFFVLAGQEPEGYTQLVRRLLAACLSVLYPMRCPSCTVIVSNDERFCPTCMPHVHPISSPFCSCCGVPFVGREGPDHLCGSCLKERPPFRHARAWAYYQYGANHLQPISEAIQKFKYHRDLSVGKTLACLAAAHYPFSAKAYDVMIPVPLHLDRLRWRGFNQALLLSHTLGTTYGILVNPFLLERSRPTVPQTQLTGKERQTNVKGAFTVSSSEQVKDKRVLLIDDVYTSGATVRECAETLIRAGAHVIDVFTLARAIS